MKLARFSAIFSGLILWSLLINSLPVRAQGEIVTSEDISGGSSVFVFRKSSKAPQSKFAPKVKPTRTAAEKTKDRDRLKKDIEKKPKPPAKAKPRPKPVTTPTPKPTTPTPKPSPGGRRTPTPKPTPAEPVIVTATRRQASAAMAAGAEIYIQRKNYNEAINQTREAIKLDPDNGLAYVVLSRALTAKADALPESDASLAVPLYKEAIENDPENAYAYAGIGAAYEVMNQDALAFENYEKAYNLDNDLTALYLPLGIGYYQRGEIDKADQLLNKAIAATNDDYQTHFLSGLIHYKKNRDQQAEQSLKRTLQLNPDLAEAYYFLGEIFDRNGRNEDAIEQYKLATKKKENYPEAWFDLGVAYYNRGNLTDALNAYGRAVFFDNGNWEAHANMADVYRQLGYNIVAKTKEDSALKMDYYTKAEGSYRIATDLAERNPKAKEDRVMMADLYSNFAFILGRMGKWNSTIEALNKAISYNPDALDYSNLGWAYYNAAQVDIQNKQPESAKSKLENGRRELSKAVAMDPNSKAALMNLGITQNDLGDFAAAVETLKKAVALAPDWNLAINELGASYKALGNLAEAAKNFGRASDIAEKRLSVAKSDFDRAVTTAQISTSLYNLALTESERGNEKESKKAQERLKKYNPNMAKILETMLLNKVKNKVDQKIRPNNPLNRIRIPF